MVKKKTFKPLSATKKEKQMPKFSSSCKVDSYALAYALAILFAAWALVISLSGMMGWGAGMVEMMQKFHPWYSLSLGGIVIGLAWSALCGLLTGFVGGWLYNEFS